MYTAMWPNCPRSKQFVKTIVIMYKRYEYEENVRQGCVYSSYCKAVRFNCNLFRIFLYVGDKRPKIDWNHTFPEIDLTANLCLVCLVFDVDLKTRLQAWRHICQMTSHLNDVTIAQSALCCVTGKIRLLPRGVFGLLMSVFCCFLFSKRSQTVHSFYFPHDGKIIHWHYFLDVFGLYFGLF